MTTTTRRTLMASAAVLTAMTLSLATVAAQDDAESGDMDAAVEMEHMEEGISVRDAWTRESMMVELAGAAYMVIHNGTDDEDRLIGAASPAAAVVEIHQTSMGEDGAMAMMPVEGIALTAHADTVLEPGGFHLMLIELAEPLVEGETIEISLQFATADAQTVSVPVTGPMGPMDADGEPMDMEGMHDMEGMGDDMADDMEDDEDEG